MIVSNLESLFVRVILGGMSDAYRRGAITPEVDALLEDFIEWIVQPGFTPAGEAEVAETPHERLVPMRLPVPCYCPDCCNARAGSGR